MLLKDPDEECLTPTGIRKSPGYNTKSPALVKSEDIKIIKKSIKLTSNNIGSEESKETKSQTSETLVKELDGDGEEIKFDSFNLHERLGKGNFGEVFKVTLKKEETKETPTNFALKAIKKSRV
mmetsp:Transcript_36026/g.35633  ORF Transcript_36026/g.35633 Transcript_36026/m.35633 type:complete len:123 (-) Transcript_36026:334-702(-)